MPSPSLVNAKSVTFMPLRRFAVSGNWPRMQSNEDITSTKKARRASLESTPDSHTPNDSSHPDCHPLQDEETSEDMEASADPTSRPLQAPDQPSTSKFRITSSRDFDTAVDSLFAIEKEFPFIDATTSITKDGDFILSANTESTKDLLNSLRTLSSGKVVNILPHTTPPRTFKSIVERFPIGFPLQRLTDLPFVVSATRCVSRTTKEETRQVLLITNDTPPPEINLGIFGKFQTRAYIPEPLRCFKCQQFGHHQAKCRASPRCAICAQPHATEGCLSKLKAGEKTEAKCPNCGGNHHAWNLRCEKRRALLPKSETPTGPSAQRTLPRKLHDWSNPPPRQPTPLHNSTAVSAVSALQPPSSPQLSTPQTSVRPVQPIPATLQGATSAMTSPTPHDSAISKFLANTIQLGLLALGRSVDPSILQLLVDNVISALLTTTHPLPRPQKESTEPQEATPATSADSMNDTFLTSDNFPPLPQPSTSGPINPTAKRQPSQSSRVVIPVADTSSSNSHDNHKESANYQLSAHTPSTYPTNG
nr:uncharacterized protein LOC113800594 [Penaeus vannamei]